MNADDNPPYSSPCGRAELDPDYARVLPAEDILALLGELLKAERAGARGVTELCVPLAARGDALTLRLLARDEGRYVTMLRRQILRLGGTPSEEVGAFYEKLAALETLKERLDLLIRGQAWVVRQLRRALPGITDDELRGELEDMLRVHETNIALSARLVASPAG